MTRRSAFDRVLPQKHKVSVAWTAAYADPDRNHPVAAPTTGDANMALNFRLKRIGLLYGFVWLAVAAWLVIPLLSERRALAIEHAKLTRVERGMREKGEILINRRPRVPETNSKADHLAYLVEIDLARDARRRAQEVGEARNIASTKQVSIDRQLRRFSLWLVLVPLALGGGLFMLKRIATLRDK
jgi:hypothetical protein